MGEKYHIFSARYILTTKDISTQWVMARTTCLVVVDAFSRFIQVNPVKSIHSIYTIEAITTFKISFGIPQRLVYDRETSFMSTDFSIFLLELGITHSPEQIGHFEQTVKLKYRTNVWVDLFCSYVPEAGSNWAKLAFQYLFAHNTSVTSSTGPPNKIVFGFKQQLPISLKVGFERDDKDLCQSNFSQILKNQTHVNKKIFQA